MHPWAGSQGPAIFAVTSAVARTVAGADGARRAHLRDQLILARAAQRGSHAVFNEREDDGVGIGSQVQQRELRLRRHLAAACAVRRPHPPTLDARTGEKALAAETAELQVVQAALPIRVEAEKGTVAGRRRRRHQLPRHACQHLERLISELERERL